MRQQRQQGVDGEGRGRRGVVERGLEHDEGRAAIGDRALRDGVERDDADDDWPSAQLDRMRRTRNGHAESERVDDVRGPA